MSELSTKPDARDMRADFDVFHVKHSVLSFLENS